MNRSTLYLLVVLVVLVIAWLVIDSARDVTSDPERFVAADTTDIDGITIINNADTIELRRAGSRWRIAEPIDYPAEGRYITDMLKKIEEMRIENFVTTDTDKDSLYGLDTAAVEVAVRSGSKEIARFHVGKAAENFRHTYCRRVGEDEIYRVKGTFSSQLKRTRKDWRDKNILDIDRDAIDQIVYEYPDEKFTLSKADTVWTMEIGTTTQEAEKRRVDQALSLLSRFRTFDFIDGDSARALDFTSPDLNLDIRTDVGDTYEFAFVPEPSDTNRYLVKKEGLENTVFVVYKGTANSVMKRADNFKVAEQEEGK